MALEQDHPCGLVKASLGLSEVGRGGGGAAAAEPGVPIGLDGRGHSLAHDQPPDLLTGPVRWQLAAV